MTIGTKNMVNPDYTRCGCAWGGQCGQYKKNSKTCHENYSECSEFKRYENLVKCQTVSPMCIENISAPRHCHECFPNYYHFTVAPGQYEGGYFECKICRKMSLPIEGVYDEETMIRKATDAWNSMFNNLGEENA